MNCRRLALFTSNAVYLDHILYPTLTDSGCYTEVHHIDGDGNDAGTDFSGKQNVLAYC